MPIYLSIWPFVRLLNCNMYEVLLIYCYSTKNLRIYAFDCLLKVNSVVLRVIPQGTVYNNLGPDRLAGPKALYPNIADNQPFDCTTFV